MLVEVGITTDGKKVLAGLFRLYETEGIPLDVIFQITLSNNMVPCWISFYKEARKNGISHDGIISKLEPAIIDSFGITWAITVIDTLNSLYNQNKL